MKKICVLILACILLLVTPVFALDYIKSVREIPIEQGYEVILNYLVDENEINAWFIDDDTHDRTRVKIEEYYKMPDGTIKLKTNYVEADRIAFYYADTFDDWSLAAMDSICDSRDMQTENAPDCIWERGYPVSMENVRLYENSEKIHMDLKNVGKNSVDIAPYWFYYNWGTSGSRTIGDLDEGEKIILKPEQIFHYEESARTNYLYRCGDEFFIGMIEYEGDNAIAIHNRDLECLEYQPTCGDYVCSKYEQFMDCDKDCDNPINLIVIDGKTNGIYFDYSYMGDNCIYHISNPNEELFTSKESLDNYKGKNLKDTIVRYNGQVTVPINNMFSSFISGDYKLDLICYEKGLEIARQSDSIFVCADCIIENECVGKDTIYEKYYCTPEGETITCGGCFINKECVEKNTLIKNSYCNPDGNLEEVGFFKKIFLKVKLLFS